MRGSGPQCFSGALFAAYLCLATFTDSSSAFCTSSSSFSFRVAGRVPASARGLCMVEQARTADVMPSGLSSHPTVHRRFVNSMALAVFAQLSAVATVSAEEAPAADGKSPLRSEKKYSGPSAYGFNFFYPASWKPNKKPGNKHLYDLEIKPAGGGKGQISMTVDAVKINKIEEYGTLEEVQERLRQQVEKLTKGASVKVAKAEKRTTSDKMTYYTVCLAWDGYQQWTTLTATANQLFALSSLIPAEAQDYAGTALASAVQSLKVKPNSLDNFQQYGKGQAPGVVEYIKQIPGEFTRIESGDF